MRGSGRRGEMEEEVMEVDYNKIHFLYKYNVLYENF